MPETTAKAIQNIQEDVAYLRLEMGTLAITSIEGTKRQTEGDVHTDHSLRKEIETLRKDLAAQIESIGNGVSYADMARGLNSLLKPTSEVVGQKPNIETVSPPQMANHIRPHFPLLIESSDPRDTSEDVVKTIKNNIDVIELGVGVNSIKKRRNQKVVMACDSAEDRAKMEQAIKTSTPKLTVSQIRAKKPLLRLAGIINDTTDRQVEEAIWKQNSDITKAAASSSHQKDKGENQGDWQRSS